MHARLAFLLFSFVIAINPLFAKDVYLSVGGSAGVFRTDARIFNPNDKEITIQAYYLPRGNINNSGEQPVTITIAKRQMKIYDDVVATLFTRGDVGAIRLTSADEFVATQRIYATSTTACGTSTINPCTLGQFVPGLDAATAKKRGVLIQLKCCDKFRTNLGAVNPNNIIAKVTWRLYDKNSNLVSVGIPVVMEPFGVIGPTALNGDFFFEGNKPGAELTDSWVTYSSDQPIFAYASIVDNGSTDQTFIPASEDVGPDPVVTQPKVVTVSARNFAFDVPSVHIHAGDDVTFRISSAQDVHGFFLVSPSGAQVLSIDPVTSVVIERTVKLTEIGSYSYFCTHFCGEGHFSMGGSLSVTAAHAEAPPKE